MPKIQLESTGTKDVGEMLVKITSNLSTKMDLSQLCLPLFVLSKMISAVLRYLQHLFETC
jgi:hypothetical protein